MCARCCCGVCCCCGCRCRSRLARGVFAASTEVRRKLRQAVKLPELCKQQAASSTEQSTTTATVRTARQNCNSGYCCQPPEERRSNPWGMALSFGVNFGPQDLNPFRCVSALAPNYSQRVDVRRQLRQAVKLHELSKQQAASSTEQSTTTATARTAKQNCNSGY